MECARLRVKDLDFERREILVREGKGDKDRMTMLPASLVEPLRAHLAEVPTPHETVLRVGAGWVDLPHALGRKLPNAGREWPWQWVFPATRTYKHPESGEVRRHHLHESVLQRAVHEAGAQARITRRMGAMC